jgi:hypothetical protein
MIKGSSTSALWAALVLQLRASTVARYSVKVSLAPSQALEHDVNDITKAGRDVALAELGLDLTPDQRVRQLIRRAAVEAELIPAVRAEVAHRGRTVGQVFAEVRRLEICDQLLARPQPHQAGRGALGEGHGEAGEVAVFRDLLAAAEHATADLLAVLALLDRRRPDDHPSDPLGGEGDGNDVAIGRSADRQVAQPRALDVRAAAAEQEVAEQSAGDRADRAEQIAGADREAERRCGADDRADHQRSSGLMAA